MGKTLGYGEITVANMTEPFTVMLTNEAQQFATDSNRKVTSAQSYYTDIIVIRGSQERTDYTIGNITSGSGITVSKSSKRVTFSVSAGATIGADTGVIEIPITLDGQTVKKQFSWSCGKQGPQGVKGDPGTSVKITSKSVTYQTSTSGTTAPTGTWSTTVPMVNNGQYLWTKTTVQYSDGNKTEAYSVSYKGTNGTNGTSVTVSKTEVTYQVSTSGTTAPTGTWSTTMPSCDQGQYLWTKTYVKYSDGKETTSYSVSYKGVDGEKFSWNLIQNGKGNEKRGFFKNFSSVNITEGYGEITLTSKHNYIGIGLSGFVLTPRQYEVGKKVTWSYDIMYTKWDFPTGTNHQEFWLGQRYTNAPSGETATGQWVGVTAHDLPVVGQNGCELNKWFHVEVTKTIPTQASSNVGHQEVINFYNSTDISATVTFRMKNVKLEYGDTATPWSPSQSDLEGRGVSQTVQYYLATSQASGVTSSTSGWSTDITTQKLTADKKYLWNCYQTKYSDGTSEPISTPKVIGVYGDKGQKGDSGEDGQDGAGFHWNLLSGTKDFDKTKMSIAGATSFDSQKYLGLTVIKATNPTSGYVDPIAWNGCITPTPNTIYTLSFYAKATKDTLCSSFFYPNCTVKNVSEYETKNGVDGQVGHKIKTEWAKYYCTWTTSSSVSGAKSIIPIRLQRGNAADDATVYLCGIKLEQSDKPSPWCTTYEETLAKNLSITPSSQYFKSTDGGKTFAPNTITIKPTIQGEISFGKWQYSIDGGVSFADVVSGQKGLTVNNNVLAVSKDSSLYSDAVTMVTFRAVANDSSFYDTCSIAKIYDVSDIGDGRNLLTGVSSYTKDAPFEKTDSRADGWIVYQNIITSIELEAGKKYVLQAKTDGNWTANHDTNGQDPSKKLVTLWLCSDTTNDFFDMRQGYVVFTPTVTAKYKLRVNQYSNGTDAYTIHLWDIKLEKGSSPTGWTPAPEDVQTAILSTKSEISDVSLKVDNNKQAIEQRVEKTTYQQDLKLVKGDISKANEGLNKWRYEIYPKSLFDSTDQGKSTIDIFAKNKNLTPSRTVLFNDTDLSIQWNSAENYIGYALTFTKFSAAKSVAITFAHDDGAHIYLNGKLIGGSDAYSQTGESLTLGFVKGWNCIEVVVNDKNSYEGFTLGTTISAISECQLMNCYYGTPVARQSHITNQLVENTTNIEGVTTTMQKVMTTVGGSDRIDEFVNNYNKTIESEKQFKKTIGETYTTKDEFNGLEIGGRNLLLYSQTIRAHNDYYGVGWLTDEVETFNGCPVWSVKNQWGRLTWLFKSHVIDRGLVKVGDTLTYSLYAKTNNASGKSINCSYRFKGNANAYWFNASAFNIGTSWARYSVTFTVTKDMLATDTYMNEIGFEETASMSGDDKVYYACPKLERGTKATDYTPAPEDDEINGQNLVSNLPSNWEQGTFDGNRVDVGGVYNTGKVDNSTRIRVKELVPVSGTITISNAYSNQSKKPIQHVINAFDVNKKYLGSGYINTDWNDFPKIVDMKDAKYIAVIVKYKDNSAITPSDISQICLKIERGTSATPFTLAPEDVNGKIVNVETIANQTAKKFEWIVKGGDSSSNFTLTDRVADLVAERINFNGLVTFSGLAKSTQDKINSPTSGNLITVSPTNPTSNYGNTTFSIVSDDVGGRCIQTTAQFVPFTNYASNIFKPGEQIYYNINVPNWSSTTFDANLGIWFFTAEKKCVANSCTRVTLQRTTWNRLSGYITVPTSGWSGIIYYVIGIENPNKYQLGLVSNSYIEKTTSYATTYASSAVNWVTNNGSSTTSLNSMVKKWTDGAVSDTTQINGGWIKANTITASKIALADFTNYSQLTRDTAATYGFAVTDDTDGTWFSTQGIRRDQFISETFPCNGGESYLIEYDISTNAKGANNSTDTKNYIDVAIGVYGYTGTVGSNGLPNKATNIWYATRVTGSEAAAVTHVKTTITTSTATKQFRIFLQSNGYYFEGTTKIRNLSVRRMYGGTLIVDGSITADKIDVANLFAQDITATGTIRGVTLAGVQGEIGGWSILDDMLGMNTFNWMSLGSPPKATETMYNAYSVYHGKYSPGVQVAISASKYVDAYLYGYKVTVDEPTYITESFQLQPHEINIARSYYQVGTHNSSADSQNETSYPNYVNEMSLSDKVLSFHTEYRDYENDTLNPVTPISSEIKNFTSGLYISSNRYLNLHSPEFITLVGKTNITESLVVKNDINGYKGMYIKGLTKFESSDTSTQNAIETIGDAIIGGKLKASSIATQNGGLIETSGTVYGGGEIQCGGGQMRIIGGNYGILLRNDGSDFYILSTDSGSPWGSWNSKRPFRINLANGIPYFEYGIIIPNENYLLGNGYQIGRGTSWGGVCIGDNSQQLRLYGSSLWAAHSISTSDENLKENFTTLDQYEEFYMNLNPIGFNYIGDYDGKKTHFGFGAHKTEDILESEGYDADKFAVVTHRPLVQEDIEKRFGKDVEVDIKTEYGVSYTEFIALNTHMIQKTRRELEQVKQEKADLEARLQAIEEKLGL